MNGSLASLSAAIRDAKAGGARKTPPVGRFARTLGHRPTQTPYHRFEIDGSGVPAQSISSSKPRFLCWMELAHGPQCRLRRSQRDDTCLLGSLLDPPGAAVVAGRAGGALDVRQLILHADGAPDHGAASFRILEIRRGERVGRWATGRSLLANRRLTPAPSVYSVANQQMLPLAVVHAYAPELSIAC